MSDKDDIFEYTKEELAYLEDNRLELEAENRRIRALFLSVFGTEEGKAVLTAIKEQLCRRNSTCFDANPVEMARRAGRQEIALELDGIIELARQEAETEL